MSRMELKENAKNSLKGKWGEAILVLIIFGVISMAVTGIALIGNNAALNSADSISKFLENPNSFNFGIPQIISSILSILVSAFLALGSVSYFLKVSRNENVTFKELFSKTSLWLLYIGVTIMTSIFIGLWSLLLIIPGIIASYRYSMVNYIMVDNPELGVFGAIKRSKEIMVGHKMDLFILQLSFIGWLLLSMLTLGILMLYVTPYMNVTFANFYNSIKDQNTDK